MVKKNITKLVAKPKPQAKQNINAVAILQKQILGSQYSLYDPVVMSKIASAVGLSPNATKDQVLKYVQKLYDAGYRISLFNTIGNNLKATVTYSSAITAGANPNNMPATGGPSLILVEVYELASYYGNYGAGKTVSTFTLLPNEKTTISIKTWKSTETTTSQASSILDSHSDSSTQSFQDSLQTENSDKTSQNQANSWNVNASATASGSAGFASASVSVSGGASGSTNSNREDFAKNVSNATQSQVSSASSKRDVQVNTSFQAKVTVGEEESIVRTIENVNAGRVLNFVFRQLNQEFITYLRLVDVKLAYAYTDPNDSSNTGYAEYPLSQIETFLATYLTSAKNDANGKPLVQNAKGNAVLDSNGNQLSPIDQVRQIIVDELRNVVDYNGNRFNILECVNCTTGKADGSLDDYCLVNNDDKRTQYYLRFSKQFLYQQGNPGSSDYDERQFPGAIMSKKQYILPTDSVIVDALLGQAEALDKYSIESRNAIIEKGRLANTIIRDGDAAAADIFAKVYPSTIKIEKDTSTNIQQGG